MSLKIVLLISAIAVAAAIEIHQPLVLHQSHHVQLEHEHEHDHKPAEYEFAYSVHDKHTGDIKAQKEIRKGDQVIGTYELIDSDGYKRIVHYKSDKHSGFEAVVHREPTHIKIPIPEPQHQHKLIATKIISSPIVHYSHAPVHHHNLLHSDEGRSDEGHGSGVSFHGSGVSYKY